MRYGRPTNFSGLSTARKLCRGRLTGPILSVHRLGKLRWVRLAHYRIRVLLAAEDPDPRPPPHGKFRLRPNTLCPSAAAATSADLQVSPHAPVPT
jgi:hypothetical protein